MANKRSIIPNSFTMGNMVMGFFAIIFASRYDAEQGNVEVIAAAGVLIFIAAIFDASDGAIARALKVESEIGGQLDSLADAISYGIAPGVIAYKAYLDQLPEIANGLDMGMLLATIFPICAIFRLAKFNVADDFPGFKGLPSPAAGILVSTIPSLWSVHSLILGDLSYVMSIEWFIAVFIAAAFLMVTPFDYSKVLSDVYRKGKSVSAIVFFAVIGLLFLFQMWAVFVLTAVYAVFGTCIYYYRKASSFKNRKKTI